MFFWIIYWGADGKWGLDGPYNSYESADKVAQKWDVTGYVVEKLPTMNASKAERLVGILLASKDVGTFGNYVKFKRKLEKKIKRERSS